MSSDSKLPLKRVVIRSVDYFNPGGGGGAPTVFGEVTPAVRSQLAGEVSAAVQRFATALRSTPSAAAVLRVELKDAALAKSHRPTALFESADCPIVGIGGFGELLVSVKEASARQLRDEVMGATSARGVANISTIRKIEPYALSADEVGQLAATLKTSPGTPLKIRVFRHGSELVDAALDDELLRAVARAGVTARQLNYAKGVRIYRLHGVRPEHVSLLAGLVGTQSLGLFPELHVVRPSAQPVGKLSSASFPPPEPGALVAVHLAQSDQHAVS